MSDGRKPGWYVTEEDGRRYWDGQEWQLEKPAKLKKEVQVFVIGKYAVPKARVFLGIVALATLAAIGGIVGAVTAEQQRQEEILAAEEAVEAQARAEAERVAAAEQLERDARATLLTQVEASVKSEAEKAQSNGWIDGSSIIAATCTPISGSLDDLLAASTNFECFSAYKDNGDGTQSGWFWDVTVNWDTGAYTWEMRY